MTEVVDKFPLSGNKFAGGAGLATSQSDDLAALLNLLAAEKNRVQNVDASTVAVAGSDTPTIEIEGDEWSTVVTDWEVYLGKYACTVASIAVASGITSLTLAATPALTDYAASEAISLNVRGKIPGRTGWVNAGSVTLVGA